MKLSSVLCGRRVLVRCWHGPELAGLQAQDEGVADRLDDARRDDDRRGAEDVLRRTHALGRLAPEPDPQAHDLPALGIEQQLVDSTDRHARRVDHGTAYDIAWQGKADAAGMRAAIELAAKLVGRGG